MPNVVLSGGSATSGGYNMGSYGPVALLQILVSPDTVFSGNVSQVQFVSPNTTLIAQGMFGSFDAAGPQTGTVTSFTFSHLTSFGGPQAMMTVTGVSLSVPLLRTWALAQDYAAIEAALFGGADTVTGSVNDDVLYGYGGDDSLTGGGGADELVGGAGVDTMIGDAGNDIIQSDGGDTIDGGAGDDRVRFVATAGGANITFASFETAAGALAGDGSLIRNVEGIAFEGAGGNDTLTWTSAHNPFGYFWGRGGTDTVQADLSASTTAVTLGPAPVGGFYQLVGLAMSDVERFLVTTGSGNDSLTGGTGNDVLSAGGGNDYLDGGLGGVDILDAGAGNDVIDSGWGPSTTITAGDGDDAISVYSSLAGTVDGGAGIDSLTVRTTSSGANVTLSSSGITIGGSAATITNVETLHVSGNPFGGDDLLTLTGPYTGTFSFFGDAGVDTFVADLSMLTAAISVGSTGLQTAGITGSFHGVEQFIVTGGSGNDSLGGGSGDDTLNGGAGNDTIQGLEGANTLNGGDGNDTILSFGSVDAANGGAGVDAIVMSLHGISSGVSMTSTAMASDAGVTFANGAVVRNFESFSIETGAGADSFTLVGAVGSNYFSGGAGFDQFVIDLSATSAGGSMDQLGTQLSLAGATVGINGDVEQLTILGGTSNNTLVGAARTDIFVGQNGVDNFNGAGGNDTLTGGGGGDNLAGGSGSDILNGGDGDDQLDGGGYNTYDQNAPPGSDVLNGGAGNDALIENDGSIADTLDGGDGLDSAVVNRSFLSAALAISSSGMASAGGVTLPDGTIIRNIEGFAFFGGSGNDTLTLDTIPMASFGNIYGGGDGVDLVQVQWGFVANDVRLEGSTLSLGNTVGGVFTATNTILIAVERYVITTGSGNDQLTGGSGDDSLTTGAGNDRLSGGSGADTMVGGDGDDLYIVENSGDLTLETSAAGGTDTVQSSVTRTLGANLENLVLTGFSAISGFGNALDNAITGNGEANQLNGFDGADTLDGGAGADSMFGGNGDDSYFVDNTGDLTTEVSALGGIDTVFSSVTRNLTANIENLTLTGASAITGAGNVLNNIITGNIAANTLYGFDGNDRLDGGAGADTLFGANGDDVYIVDDVNDITVEGSPSGGIDTVESSISRNLNANFENLVLTGVGATVGYGNILNNVMTGNAAANALYGFDGNDTLDGGGGADQMFGAKGDDTYVVDNSGDVTSEVSALGGIDTVLSSVTRNLTANLENLTLTGNAAISGAGNALDNVIIGNTGANTLFGLDGADTLDGGLGVDVLQGGAGADTYVFSTALDGGNVDTIINFNVADDAIELDSAIFTGLALGTLDAGAFHIGAAATDAAHRIIYDSATGALWFDADGDGAGAAIQFAALTPGLALTNSDFIIGG